MREWESDPLFAAAEVVQDSADRMESIYRLLLHEQRHTQGNHRNGELLSSVEYHRRDLATALETAKWQLEDFEREVNLLAFADKSQVKQNVITRHLQFISAIREQTRLVEQSMSISLGNSLTNMHLSEQDRDGLTIFLSGGNHIKHVADEEREDSNILRSFLDPAVSSSSREDNDGGKSGETISFLDHDLELKEISQTRLYLGSSSSVQEANYGRYDEEGDWDLEAGGAEARTYFQINELRDFCGRTNIFVSVRNFLTVHGKRASRSFTKRLKDGEEQRSPVYINSRRRMQRYLASLRSTLGVSNFHLPRVQIPAHALQSSSWITDLWEKWHTSFRNHPVLFLSSLLLTLFVLSIWVF